MASRRRICAARQALAWVTLLALSGHTPAQSGNKSVAQPVNKSMAQPGNKSTAQPADSSAALAGTRWRLLRLQSMDDAQPPRQPQAGAVYELHFGADGQVTMQLDCNRARGPYEARESLATARGSTPSGSLRIGPLSATRAHCGAQSLEPTLMRQWPYVRSWLLRDGRLHMSLMADGGILDWAPVAPAAPR